MKTEPSDLDFESLERMLDNCRRDAAGRPLVPRPTHLFTIPADWRVGEVREFDLGFFELYLDKDRRPAIRYLGRERIQ